MTLRCEAHAAGREAPLRWPSPLVLLGLALLAAGGLACGRTGGYPTCPAGFVASSTTGACVCSSDAVCPAGFTCDDGACRCDGDACCPQGHQYVAATPEAPEACVCRDDSCCPEGTTYDARAGGCACTSDACCPPGHSWDEATSSCACTADSCCPEGFRFDRTRAACVCAGDACCPAGYLYDAMSDGCACGQTECCPQGNTFDPQTRACICTGVGCCPAGFAQDPEGRCVCTEDSACPAGLRCDLAQGRCLCTGDEDCAAGSFCNRFGSCQSLSGCSTNEDCPATRFCDSRSRQCLLRGQCGTDTHCGLGEICTDTRCVSGCRTTGDCRFDDVCIAGRCQSGRCEGSSYCDLGSFCDLGTQSCGPRDDRYCRACEDGCTDGPCLITIIEGAGFTFCGVPCQDDADCPGGMGCADSYTNCGGPGGPCPDGLVCLETRVLNQPDTSFLCADPATQEVVPTDRFCGPRTRRCG